VSAAPADAPGDIVNRIAASALAGWIANTKTFFYFRAYSRRYEVLYMASAADSKVQLERRLLPDLLMHYLFTAAPGSELTARHYIGHQTAALPADARA
jgi:hypothetical protein